MKMSKEIIKYFNIVIQYSNLVCQAISLELVSRHLAVRSKSQFTLGLKRGRRASSGAENFGRWTKAKCKSQSSIFQVCRKMLFCSRIEIITNNSLTEKYSSRTQSVNKEFRPPMQVVMISCLSAEFQDLLFFPELIREVLFVR